MTLTSLEMHAHEVSQELYQRKPSTRPLSWRAALWSVISVRWAAVALALFLAALTAQRSGAAETVVVTKDPPSSSRSAGCAC